MDDRSLIKKLQRELKEAFPQLRNLLQESIARESTLKKENEDLTSKPKESEAGRAMVQNEMNLLVSLLH